jgi:hypothetical protein
MADDIIPGIQAGQGSGPQGIRPAGVDYRSLQNPAQVRTDLPSSGAAERAAELGRVFKEFSSEATSVSDTLSSQAGSIAGAAAGATGHPQYRTGLQRFSTYSQAFNNAATGAYAIQAEAFADDTAARLRVEANNDPAHFATTFTAVRDAVVKNAPPQAQAMLTELYNKHLANGLAAISNDQATEIHNTQRQAYDVGVDRQTSRVAILQGSPNPQDQLAAEDEHAKLSALIDGGVNAGLYSKAEAESMHISAMRTITAQVFQTQFDRELNGPDGALGAVKLLDNFQSAHLANLSDPNATPILSEPEYQKLYADGVTKLREYNLGIASLKRGDKTAEELRFEAGDKQYTSALLDGTLTERDLSAAVRSGDIRPERATSLRSQMLQGPGEIKSNPNALFKLHTDPNFLSMTPDEISQIPGISKADALKAVQEVDRRNNSWEGTQNVKNAKLAIGVALKITPGTPSAALSDEQRKAYSEATLDFVNRMNALPPAQRDSSAATVAQDVVKGENRKQAAAQVTDLTNAKQSYIQRSGPASNSPVSEDEYNTRIKHYDQLIKQSQAAAKGE